MLNPELEKELLLTPLGLSQLKEQEFIDGRWHYFNPYEIERTLLSSIEQKGYSIVKVDEKLRERVEDVLFECIRDWESRMPAISPAVNQIISLIKGEK